jgi:hypothetical protein
MRRSRLVGFLDGGRLEVDWLKLLQQDLLRARHRRNVGLLSTLEVNRENSDEIEYLKRNAPARSIVSAGAVRRRVQHLGL